MRQTRSRRLSADIGGASIQILGWNDKRISVTISPGLVLGRDGFFAFGETAVTEQGYAVRVGNEPLHLHYDQLGDSIHQPLNGIALGQDVFPITEVYEV